MPRPPLIRKGTWYLLAACAIVGTAATYAYIHAEPPRDAQMCSEAIEHGHTIILIDKSDPWTASQSERLKNHILRIANSEMHQEERLTIYYFNSYVEPGFPHVFSFCKPQKQANVLTQGTLPIERAYKQQFGDPLDKVLHTLKVPEQGDCSPILETIVDILQRVETKKRKGQTRLVIFSDLLQNSSKFSFFNHKTCYPTVGTPPLQTELFLRRQLDSNKRILIYLTSQKPLLKLHSLRVTIFQTYTGTYPESLLDGARSRWTQWFSQFAAKVDWERM